jgi:hypothetical protein
LKKVRNVSAPIAIAIYQLITARGMAVITSIITCCFTNTVDTITSSENIIIISFKNNGRPVA